MVAFVCISLVFARHVFQEVAEAEKALGGEKMTYVPGQDARQVPGRLSP